ncbi:MAG: hypothetical protein HKN42_19075, partial [Granulosicoccus sp.]|nr:hypothetical protein [Granulosicoccus sp.]
QTVKWALIPQRTGALVLPEVRVEWFNTTTGNVETAVLPEEIILVAPPDAAVQRPLSGIPGAVEPGTPGGGSAANEAMAASNTATAVESPGAVDRPGSSVDALAAGALPSGSVSGPASNPMTAVASGPASSGKGVQDGAQSMATVQAIQASADSWRNVALASLTLWFLGLGWILWRRWQYHPAPGLRRGQAGDSPRHLDAVRQRVGEAVQSLSPLTAVSTACKGSDPVALRTALLDWAARQWTADPPLTLSAISSRLPKGEARDLLMTLDAALYSRVQGESGTQTLMSSLSDLPRHLSEAISGDSESPANRGNDSPAGNEGHRRRGLPAL